jgi:4-amino-4-deoxy-L-arabinose transferase-like glycosyltransferase
MAVLVGIGTGLTIRGTIGSQLVQQIQATMLKLNSIDNIIMVVGTVTTLLFFYFTLTRENKVVKVSGTIGKYVMMIAFGASFGNSVMSRMSMMIGRVQFLLGDWLGFLG